LLVQYSLLLALHADDGDYLISPVTPSLKPIFLKCSFIDVSWDALGRVERYTLIWLFLILPNALQLDAFDVLNIVLVRIKVSAVQSLKA